MLEIHFSQLFSNNAYFKACFNGWEKFSHIDLSTGPGTYDNTLSLNLWPLRKFDYRITQCSMHDTEAYWIPQLQPMKVLINRVKK